VRRDTAKPNGDLLRCRFSTLGVTQTDFVAGRGFTLRTFQRALAGVPITKVALRKVAEALCLPYEQATADPGPRSPDAGLACMAAHGLGMPVELAGPGGADRYPATGVDNSQRPNRV
jgi:hypothetical protein